VALVGDKLIRDSEKSALRKGRPHKNAIRLPGSGVTHSATLKCIAALIGSTSPHNGTARQSHERLLEPFAEGVSFNVKAYQVEAPSCLAAPGCRRCRLKATVKSTPDGEGIPVTQLDAPLDVRCPRSFTL